MRQHVSYVILLLFSLLILQIVANSVLAQNGDTKSTYVSQNLGFQFQYPMKWGEPLDSNNFDCKTECPITFAIRDPNSIDLFIIRIDSYNLDGGVPDSCNCNSLMDFVKWDYHRTFMMNNDLIAQNRTRVNSHHNAWQMELISIGEKEANKKLLAWTIDGNNGYRIQYSAPTSTFARYLPEFESMLNSFIFAEQNEARKPTCILFSLFCL